MAGSVSTNFARELLYSVIERQQRFQGHWKDLQVIALLALMYVA
jgi:hypothetical protein